MHEGCVGTRVMPVTDWEDVLLAYLHDPFDKALAVQGHETRAARYASAALGRDVSRKGLHRLAASADVVAAIAERVPSPIAGGNGERAVGPEDGLRILHPASGAHAALSLTSLDPDKAVAVIEEIVRGLSGPRERFLAIWRLLPDAVAAEFGDDAARLPADTRIPDHALFQHTDVTTGLYAAGAPDGDAAFLSFTLGPVQPFIEAARSVRDLWSGSALLSWLAFQAMKPILEQPGPTAFVFPAMRDAPLMDLWLSRDAGLADRVPLPPRYARMAPSLHCRLASLRWRLGGRRALPQRRCSRHVRTRHAKDGGGWPARCEPGLIRRLPRSIGTGLVSGRRRSKARSSSGPSSHRSASGGKNDSRDWWASRVFRRHGPRRRRSGSSAKRSLPATGPATPRTTPVAGKRRWRSPPG